MQNKEMRAVYAETLIELAEKNKGIVILEADLMRANGTGIFAPRWANRRNCGATARHAGNGTAAVPAFRRDTKRGQ